MNPSQMEFKTIKKREHVIENLIYCKTINLAVVNIPQA